MGEAAKKILAENPEVSRHPYTSVPESQFKYLYEIPITLYLKIGNEFIVFVEKHDPTRSEVIDTLFDQKIKRVYVHLTDSKLLFRETERHLREIIDSPKIAFEDKAQALNAAALSVIEDLFENPDNAERLHSTRPLIESHITLLQNHPKSFIFMSNLGAHDYYSYTHSIGVANYSLAYCLTNKVMNEGQIPEAGQAALLHDIGKAKVPWEIINKKDKLTEREWQAMKQHPVLGHAILMDSGFNSDLILQATRNHHENLDGSGYPDGLKDDELHEITQVVGMSDVFSALTTNRSYSNARSSFEAFKFMKDTFNNKFRQEIFRNFLLMFHE